MKLIKAITVLLIAAPAFAATTWPTLHNDYQRSGYTDEVVEGPYERKWHRDFHGEMIASRVEAIVAEGLCFVPTFAGNLYAMDVRDGSTAWTFKADGPIGHSPCYEDGRLYVDSDDAFNQGTLYCLQAEDGGEIWRHRVPAGVWTSPACDGETVYFGDRAGMFHALDAKTGRPRWTFETGYMILTPASFSPDGRQIVFASEDMHVYALSPDGKLLWKTSKLPGLSLRDHAPTIWKDLAIVRTNPADGFHTTMGLNGQRLEEIQRSLPLQPEDEVLLDKWGDYILKPTHRRRDAEQKWLPEYLRDNPDYQTFFALRLADGSQPWVSQVLYTCGLHNPATPPTFNPKTGELYTFYRTALTNYIRGIRRYSALGRMDPGTGLIDWCWPDAGRDDWYGFPMIGDETQSLSMMGPYLLANHQGELCALDLRNEKITRIWAGRDTYGGIFGPGALPGKFDEAKQKAAEGWLTGMPNEWHGPDRSIVAIAEGRIFWVVGSQVVCIAGPQVPKTATGGTEPPAPIKSKLTLIHGGNMTASGSSLHPEVPKQRITFEQALDMAQTRDPRTWMYSDSPLAGQVRERLDAEVLELVDQGPWAPFMVELGIVREEEYFRRTSETMHILALALPHVSEPVRRKAVAHIAALLEEGAPLEKVSFKYEGRKHREHYDYGPGMRSFAQRDGDNKPRIGDLYALWAAAHYGDLWQPVLARLDRIETVYREFADQAFAFDHDDNRHDAAQHLNRQIAGTLAYARIMHRAGRDDRVEPALRRLAEMLTERIHHERADSRVVRYSDNGQGNYKHNAKVPRYVDLVPELAAAVAQYAPDKLDDHVRGLDVQLPVWHQAFGERMIGGENYISPPHLARGLFIVLADGLHAEPGYLAKKLDQPWCRADLYYIEKCTALLRRLDRPGAR